MVNLIGLSQNFYKLILMVNLMPGKIKVNFNVNQLTINFLSQVWLWKKTLSVIKWYTVWSH